MVRKYGQRFVVSQNYLSSVYESFPWNPTYKNIPEMRDLRRFVLEELGKAYWADAEGIQGTTSLRPAGLTCQYVTNSDFWSAWMDLLRSCVASQTTLDFDVQVATWDAQATSGRGQSMVLTVSRQGKTEVHELPLIWDQKGWSDQLSAMDVWPDLQKCVELYYLGNSGLQDFAGVRTRPIPFGCTETFVKAARELGRGGVRLSLVKALTKRVYGVLDAGLVDEQFGEIRRLRVTGFWRVHYREVGQRLIFEDFGEHDIGM